MATGVYRNLHGTRIASPPPMDLDEVRAFVAVIDSGSFKAAASAVSQPRGTLRRRVDSLETRAGMPLLERGRSGVALTEAGAVLLLHGRQMIRDAGALFGALRSLHGGATKVRIGLPLGLPPEGLHKLFAFLERSAPKLRVDLRFSEDPAKELLGAVDFALCFSHQLPHGHLVSKPLVEMREGLRASEAYIKRHGAPQSLAQLREHRLLGWLDPRAETTRWPLLSGGSVEVEPAVASADFQLLRRLAARGSGIALLPDVNLPDLDPEDRKLVRVLGDVVGRKHHLHLVVTEAQLDNKKFEILSEQLRHFLGMVVPAAMIRPWSS